MNIPIRRLKTWLRNSMSQERLNSTRSLFAMSTRTFWTTLTFTKLPLTLLDVLIFGSLCLTTVLFNYHCFLQHVQNVILQLFAIAFGVDNWDNKKPRELTVKVQLAYHLFHFNITGDLVLIILTRGL